jgi:hypothetical protein
MATAYGPTPVNFAHMERRAAVAGFDGERVSSDAGAQLLGATDRVIGINQQLTARFDNARDPALIGHNVETLVMQRVIGIALGYEDWSTPTNCATTQIWRRRAASLRPGAVIAHRSRARAR